MLVHSQSVSFFSPDRPKKGSELPLGEMLACAGLLRAVAGVSVPTDGPAALLAHGDGSGIKLALSCEEGCAGKQFCLAAPCWNGEKCETAPRQCFHGWGSCDQGKKSCPTERRSELCARASGEVCAKRFGQEQQENNADQRETDWATIDWSEMPKGTCYAVADDGTTDDWCTKTCATSPCPPSVCRCGEKEAAPSVPTVKTPAATRPVAPSDNKGLACVSISTRVDDYWCETTCQSQACPTSICKCGADVAAERAAKKAVR